MSACASSRITSFVASAGGRVSHHLAQFANLIDAAVGGRIDFNHVEGISEADLAAGIALVAGFRGGPLRAVERFGENARGGCFAHAARSGKNVGMRHSPGLDGVGQRARDVLLPDHVAKRLRPPFSRDDLVAHSRRNPEPLRQLRSKSKNCSSPLQRRGFSRAKKKSPGLKTGLKQTERLQIFLAHFR